MRTTILCIATAFVLLSTAAAQEVLSPVSTDWEFVPQPGGNQFFKASDPHYDSAKDEYVLTLDKAYDTIVKAYLKSKFQFCAKDYLVEYEMHLDDNTPTGGGMRFGLFYKDDISDPQVIVEADLYQDGGSSSPWTAWEIDNNHIAIETQLGSLNVGPKGWDTATHTVKTCPFALSGTEWVKVQLRYKKGDVSVDIDKGTESFRLLAKAEHRANAPLHIAVGASTKPSSAEGSPVPQLQRVRNIKVFVLEECDSSKTVAEVIEAAKNVADLDQCPIATEPQSAFTSFVDALKQSQAINKTVHKQSLEHLSNKLNFCKGGDADNDGQPDCTAN